MPPMDTIYQPQHFPEAVHLRLRVLPLQELHNDDGSHSPIGQYLITNENTTLVNFWNRVIAHIKSVTF